MHPVLRNILAVVSGLVAGSMVNMGLVMLGGVAVPPPEGTDLTTTEGLKAAMHLMEPRHFVFPFLAHAGGTFVGAWLAALVASGRKMSYALLVGLFFFAGGVASICMLPSPLGFTILDLAGAYFPMAWLGGRTAIGRNK